MNARTWLGYLLAIVATGIALGIALALSAFNVNAPRPVLIVGIIVAAWYGGVGPALLSTALSALAVIYFYVEPLYTLEMPDPSSAFNIVVFIAVALIISLFNNRFKQALQKAEASQLQFEAILSGVGDAVIATSPDGLCVFANPPAARLLGIPDPAVLLGADMASMMAEYQLSSEDGEPLRWTALPEGDGEPRVVLLRLQDTDEQRCAYLRHQVIRGKQQEAQLAITVLSDITDLRRAENLRDEFLSAAAHDLRTPLTAISGLVQLIRRRQLRAEPSGNSLVADLDRVNKSVAKMAGLVDEFLDMSRIESHRAVQLRLSTFDLRDLLAEVVAEHEHLAQKHVLRFDPPAEPIDGYWDRSRLSRVFANLVSNAIKYSPSGGEVVLSAGVEGSEAFVTCRDEGIGVPDADRERIFGRFERGSNVGEGIAGTGVGLSYARHIVQRHGGSIVVGKSETGGSIFTVRLPLTPNT